MNIKDTINNGFAKLPFKGMAEKIPEEKRAKVPVLGKLIPWTNQIVCGLAVILIIIIIAAASGESPKALAKETYELYQQTLNIGTNLSKAEALSRKEEKIQAKVEKLSGDKQAVYMEELGRLMGSNLDLFDIAGIDLSYTPASGTANKQADFKFELTGDGKGVIITGVSGNPKTVNIPSKFEGVPVVEIGYGAFEDHFGITSITIPNSVKKIGEVAFAGTGITKIVIPDSVTEIGSGLFYQCIMLTEIKLSDNISRLHPLEGEAVKKINLPKNLKEIVYNAFYSCEELIDLTIPNAITKLTFFKYDFDNFTGGVLSTVPIVPLKEDEIPRTFEGCQKLSIKTRQRLKQLGYTGEF